MADPGRNGRAGDPFLATTVLLPRILSASRRCPTLATTVQTLMAASAPMYQGGATQDQVDAMFTQDWCLVKLGSGGLTGVRPMGGIGNGDVTWSTSLWFDRDSGYDFAQGNWTWHNHDYATGFNFGCTSSNVGGRDGIGLRLSASNGVGYLLHGGVIEGWGDPGLNSYSTGNYGTWSLSQPSAADAYGVAYLR